MPVVATVRVADGAERHPQALDGSERGGSRPLQHPIHVGMGDQPAGLVDEEGMARAPDPYARDQLPDELEIDLRDDDAGRAAIAPTATLMKDSEPPAKVTDPNQTPVARASITAGSTDRSPPAARSKSTRERNRRSRPSPSPLTIARLAMAGTRRSTPSASSRRSATGRRGRRLRAQEGIEHGPQISCREPRVTGTAGQEWHENDDEVGDQIAAKE
jgi:hypothetical protein